MLQREKSRLRYNFKSFSSWSGSIFAACVTFSPVCRGETAKHGEGSQTKRCGQIRSIQLPSWTWDTAQGWGWAWISSKHRNCLAGSHLTRDRIRKKPSERSSQPNLCMGKAFSWRCLALVQYIGCFSWCCSACSLSQVWISLLHQPAPSTKHQGTHSGRASLLLLPSPEQRWAREGWTEPRGFGLS